MWKIFNKQESSIEKSLLSIEKWKEDLFLRLSIDVKHYFAKKVIVYFDNNMMFQQKRGLHINLMEALSQSEKEMLNIQGVFPRIESYWLRDKEAQSLIVFGLNDKDEHTLNQQGFKLIQRDIMPSSNNMEAFEYNAWKTLVFDVELVNYSSGWINFIPELELRAALQAEYILLNTHFKKQNMTLLEKIQFEKNIRQHASFEAMYEKIIRIMPKIEQSLKNEWNEGILPIAAEETIKKVRKKKI